MHWLANFKLDTDNCLINQRTQLLLELSRNKNIWNSNLKISIHKNNHVWKKFISSPLFRKLFLMKIEWYISSNKKHFKNRQTLS